MEHQSRLIEQIDYPNGDSYRGEVDGEGLPHGVGTMTYAQHPASISMMGQLLACKRYHGSWSHGLRSGRGEMAFYADGRGTANYRGEWHEDLPEGEGAFTAQDKSTTKSYRGGWLRGLRHGQGEYTMHWRSGIIPDEHYIGSWLKDNYSGRGVLTHKGEGVTRFEGEFLSGLKEGEGELLTASGDHLCCTWHAGRMQGPGRYTLADGRSFRAVWVDNQIDLNRLTLEGGSGAPLLCFELYEQGLDYNRTLIGLVEAQQGEICLADLSTLRRDRGFRDERVLLCVERIEEGRLHYLLPGEFTQSGAPLRSSIAVGEAVEHCYHSETSATIYGEEHDYTIHCGLKIYCRP